MKLFTCAAAVLALATVAACSQQAPAEKAVAAAESALAAVNDEAVKYVPDEYKTVKAELDKAREALTAGNYAEAIAAVQNVPAQAATLAAHAADAKAKLAEKLKGDWEGLASSVPGMVQAVEAKLTELASKTKLPKGMDKAMIDEATTELTRAKAAWDTASQKFAAGDFEQAVANAMATQTITQKLMVALGLAPAEPPLAADAPAPAAAN